MKARLGAGSCLLVGLGLLAACGDSSGPDGNKATAIAVVSGADQTGQVGTVLAQPIVVRVTNSEGTGLAGKAVTFRVAAGGGSVAVMSATTDASGQAQTTWRLGNSTADGQRAEATTEGVSGAASFLASATAGPAALLGKLTNVGCHIPAGAQDLVVRATDSFGNPVTQARVDWTAAGGGNVTPSSSTTDAEGRASTRWTAGTTGEQSATARVNSSLAIDFNTQASAARAIAVGQVLTLQGAGTRCNDLDAGSARYLVAVTNTTPTATSSTSFEVSGALAGSATTAAMPVVASYDFTRASRGQHLPEFEQARAAATAHQQVLAASMDVVRQMQSSYAMAPRVQAQRAAAAEPPPNVGDTLSIRVPNVRNLTCNLSSQQGQIRARVVYSGTRGVVLEDVAAPLAGTMDDLYRQLGQEFDNVMWPILNDNYGDPLSFDAQTDANQRIFMVFSKLVNDMNTVAGFVVSTDFYDPAGSPSCPISNRREIFYARVPTSSATGAQTFQQLTKENWYRVTRTVLIHEGKHLVAFAHRFARTDGRPTSSDFEESWLEEASAMTAEELWARTIYGYAQRGNVNYRSSLHCEVRPQGFSECGPPTMPRAMFDHFFLLHDYQTELERLSPLGSTGTDDFTWYGSGWAFLRWALDHAGGNESTFLKDVTQSQQRGVANIEARTGRSFADLITDWTLMLALDDRAGFTPPQPQLTMPSWNLPDIFLGMSNDFPASQGGFLPTPLALRRVTFGSFNVNVGRVQGGSASIFEFSGSQAGRQLLEFRTTVGSALPPTLRLSIVRLQ